MEPIKHLPRDASKYIGNILERPRKNAVAYLFRIKTPNVSFFKTVYSYEEAVELLKEKNIEFELPIKNVIWEYPDRLEVELTRGKRMKCDKADRDLVEKHIWYTRAISGYASTNINSRTIRFHNLKTGHVPTSTSTVDHIDRNSLDNRAANLRVVNQRTQAINRNLQSNNTSGTRGVSWRAATREWVATWQDSDGNALSKSFSVKKYGETEAKQMAIDHRHQMETTLPHYITALQA